MTKIYKSDDEVIEALSETRDRRAMALLDLHQERSSYIPNFKKWVDHLERCKGTSGVDKHLLTSYNNAKEALEQAFAQGRDLGYQEGHDVGYIAGQEDAWWMALESDEQYIRRMDESYTNHLDQLLEGVDFNLQERLPPDEE